MGAEFVIDNMDDMCDLMCNNQAPESPTRKEVAHEVFELLKKSTNQKVNVIWQAIAETDDESLVEECWRLKNG